ncbi:MAG: hypothetical protein ABSE39_10490 [Candidatus Bathyarchaeia archaeon]|jgi:hypothetical protein
MSEVTFLGEMELTTDRPDMKDFQSFESLSNVKAIQHLAVKFTGEAELMPYQKEGESPKLLVSIYLRPKDRKGRVIVVLVRQDYPEDMMNLKTVVRKALARLEALIPSAGNFDGDSLEGAQRTLSKLLAEIP